MNIKKIYRVHFESIDSTHLWAKNHLNELNQEGITCITADTQTQGQGRFHRKWHSPKGNLYLSLFFTLPKESKIFVHIRQILCFSLAMVLKNWGFAPTLKWPNDLLLCDKKVSGVLTEIISIDSKVGVLTGIGVNVNLSEKELPPINQAATSLAIISGKNWDIEKLLNQLTQEFCTNLLILEKEGFAPFYPTYNALLAWKEKEVICDDGKQKIQGICKGIAEDGSLKLLLPDQTLLTMHTGDLQKTLRYCP